MHIRAITNQKGGVGKTTTSVNLGAALAEAGRKVLLIDLDPQGNLSTHVGEDIYNLDKSLYDVLTCDTPLIEVIRPTGLPGLYCAPSNIDLSGAEVEMVSAVGRETILKEALETLARDPKSPEAFDTVLIDCPPSLGLLCINALAAADEILIPMQTEFFALQGMSKLMEVVEIVKKRINPSLTIGGIVACRMDTRTRLSAEVLDDIADHFPDLLFKTRIRQNVKLAEAPSFGQTIIEYAKDSNGAEDYRRLAAEVLGVPYVDSESEDLADDDEPEESDENETEEIASKSGDVTRSEDGEDALESRSEVDAAPHQADVTEEPAQLPARPEDASAPMPPLAKPEEALPPEEKGGGPVADSPLNVESAG